MSQSKKYTKQILCDLFNLLFKEKNRIPLRSEWSSDDRMPSEMPIRTTFGSWNNFVKECGHLPRISKFSDLAKENSVNSRKGKTGGNNKGGKILDKHGYVLLWRPDHPNCKTAGYVHEHRLVMSDFIGRPLFQKETVHHKNGIRSDNRIENLELWDANHPSGQRVEDKIEWAIDFLQNHGFDVIKH